MERQKKCGYCGGPLPLKRPVTQGRPRTTCRASCRTKLWIARQVAAEGLKVQPMGR